MEAVKIPQPLREAQSYSRITVPPRRTRRQALFAPELMGPAMKQAFVMLRPDIQWANPVMFVVEVGAFLTLLYVVSALAGGAQGLVPVSYFIALDAW